MTLTEMFQSQLTDPFRIGMLVFLTLTMLRARATSGTVLPLAIGAVFVAGLIPLTLSKTPMGPELYRAFGAGIVANAVILAVLLAAYRLWSKRR